MFASLRFRLWLTYVLVAGVVIVIAGAAVAVYLLRNPAADRRELQRLRVVSNLALRRSQVFDLSGQVPAARLQEVARRLDNATDVRVAVLNDSGELLVDSRSGLVSPLPEGNFFLEKRNRLTRVFRDQQGQQWLYLVTPLEGGNYLVLSVPRPRLQVLSILRDEFLTPFVRGFAIALALSLAMAFWIAHWIAAPLQNLANAATETSLGKFRKLPLKGPTEVKQVAVAFNEMGERVQASQRSQRDFIANVSHDLKTPLTSIQGFAQAILDGAADDRAAAQVIYDEAGRMNSMVNDLLDLARLDSGAAGLQQESIDLASLLGGLVLKFTPQARQAQVELSLSVGDPGAGLPPILGDPDRLAQVFSNLLDNGLKYTPAGGRVDVWVHPSGNWMEVQVADSGPGIPPDELERIFERFYQTDKARPGGSRRGVGLGLAIASEIVEAHGGSIAAYNRQGLGPGRESTPVPYSGDSERQVSIANTQSSGAIFIVRLPAFRPDDSTPVRRKKDQTPR
jgi:signal transduction histidine kinase